MVPDFFGAATSPKFQGLILGSITPSSCHLSTCLRRSASKVGLRGRILFFIGCPGVVLISCSMRLVCPYSPPFERTSQYASNNDWAFFRSAGSRRLGLSWRLNSFSIQANLWHWDEPPSSSGSGGTARGLPSRWAEDTPGSGRGGGVS